MADPATDTFPAMFPSTLAATTVRVPFLWSWKQDQPRSQRTDRSLGPFLGWLPGSWWERKAREKSPGEEGAARICVC